MQRMIQIESPLFIKVEEDGVQISWKTIFGNENPLALEIGCGVGDFMAKVAVDNPGINFIAIDYYNKGCDKTCKRIEKLGLTNVRVLRVEAREFIATHIPTGSLTAVYINCPDPWPKKRHRKRRLVNPDFLRFLRDYLAPEGDFYFTTDFKDYGEDVAAFMPKMDGFANELAPDLYTHDLSSYYHSKYMLKFMAQGSQIYFVHYKKG
ncbi:MAG: tRNA (guanosine(46)-N7)-methyltransferase TrmB [Desulfuromonadales bacterium]|nr:tRNA (guanosine(46)-N7)-methyltransferase TrmB [Desulfuromonadales bacterium]